MHACGCTINLVQGGFRSSDIRVGQAVTTGAHWRHSWQVLRYQTPRNVVATACSCQSPAFLQLEPEAYGSLQPLPGPLKIKFRDRSKSVGHSMQQRGGFTVCVQASGCRDNHASPRNAAGERACHDQEAESPRQGGGVIVGLLYIYVYICMDTNAVCTCYISQFISYDMTSTSSLSRSLSFSIAFFPLTL